MIRVMGRNLPIAAALLLTYISTPVHGGSFKCWTNQDGVTECGNTIPPEYAQDRSRTINDKGMTISVQERAKTPEELEAERQRALEEQQRREQEARRRAERLEYDRILRATFVSEQDIIDLRNRKLAALEANIGVTERAIEEHERKLAELRRQAATSERSGQPISEELKADMQLQRDLITDKRRYIAGKQAEMEAIRAEYRQALERFRELNEAAPPKR